MNASLPLLGHQENRLVKLVEQLKLQFQKMALVREQKSCCFGWLLYIAETTA